MTTERVSFTYMNNEICIKLPVAGVWSGRSHRSGVAKGRQTLARGSIGYPLEYQQILTCKDLVTSRVKDLTSSQAWDLASQLWGLT
eukprot:1152199-Pelagomonas_calceolata.AAC.3